VIEFLPDTTGNVVGISFRGKLYRGSYRDVLAPRIESLLERFASLRVLILIDESFRGWSVPAAWANTVFDVKHRRDFDKIAMVGAPTWEEWCVKAPATLLLRGELRTFPRSQLNQAWEWLHS
jgi:hypothetical protein